MKIYVIVGESGEFERGDDAVMAFSDRTSAENYCEILRNFIEFPVCWVTEIPLINGRITRTVKETVKCTDT